MEYTQTLKQALEHEPTEFEVQSDCYQYLKQKYPIVRGEVKVQFEREFKGMRRQRGARYDIVVCDSNLVPLFIIEVKRKETMTNSKSDHYEKLSGIKCYTAGSLEQCISITDKLNG